MTAPDRNRGMPRNPLHHRRRPHMTVVCVANDVPRWEGAAKVARGSIRPLPAPSGSTAVPSAMDIMATSMPRQRGISDSRFCIIPSPKAQKIDGVRGIHSPAGSGIGPRRVLAAKQCAATAFQVIPHLSAASILPAAFLIERGVVDRTDTRGKRGVWRSGVCSFLALAMNEQRASASATQVSLPPDPSAGNGAR